MFDYGDIVGASGQLLQWKIECDDLSDDDIDCIAKIVSSKFLFDSAWPIPTGGNRFADALNQYGGTGELILVVDDVLTTGSSIKNYIHNHENLHFEPWVTVDEVCRLMNMHFVVIFNRHSNPSLFCDPSNLTSVFSFTL